MDEKNVKEQNSNKKLSFLADQFMANFQNQSSDFDKFDQKVSWFFIFQSTLLVFFLKKEELIAVLLFMSICFSICAIYPRKTKLPYSPKSILNKFWIKDNIDIESAQAQIVVNISDAIETNKGVYEKKVYLSKWSIIFFIGALAVAILKFVFHFENICIKI